jgi:N-acetylneuraminic acid mutarotase
MKKFPVSFLPRVFVPVVCAVFMLAADQPKIPPMPAELSGNAVAGLRNGIELYSLMGIGPRKAWDDITNKVFVLHLSSAKWSEGRPVPGVGGRLGASAVGARNKIYVFGGYLVDGQGGELTVADVNTYQPDEKRWYRAEDIPVPVDSAVIGLTHDRYIYLVGGRSKNGPVNNVQVYDAVKNSWSQATPFPGTPVFGHAGGVADEAIVIVDGAKKNPAGAGFVSSDACWLGKIDRKDPNKVEWSKLPAHPGPGRFGIVAGQRDKKIVFSGGTPTPHNFKGLDADGKTIAISPVTFEYDVHGNHWETITDDTFDVRTDTRGMVSTPVGELILGGTLSNQAPTARVMMVPKR